MSRLSNTLPRPVSGGQFRRFGGMDRFYVKQLELEVLLPILMMSVSEPNKSGFPCQITHLHTASCERRSSLLVTFAVGVQEK